MLGLSDGERISMIRSAVLTQYTRVTDRRTDGRTDGIGVAYIRAIAYMLSRVKTENKIYKLKTVERKLYSQYLYQCLWTAVNILASKFPVVI